MEDKKEVQAKISENASLKQKVTEEEFLSILRMVSPGTNMRVAIEGTLKAGKGALIAVENDNLLPLIDGGFRIYSKFTPQKLIELSKMDGAIILSKDMKRINHANVLLTPESRIPSLETGTRHKAAERTAKQTGGLVVAISERKHEVHLYYKNIKHALRPTEEILRKVNEQVQILEKQRDQFDGHIEKLTQLELRNYLGLSAAIHAIQKGRIIQKIAEGLKRYLIELGNEGTVLKTRLKEITTDVEKETNLIIKDYTNLDLKKSRSLLDDLSYEEILDKDNILTILDYQTSIQTKFVKGWRILSKTSLPEPEIAVLIKELGTLGKIINSGAKSYSPIIGVEKANTFKEEIEKIKLNA